MFCDGENEIGEKIVLYFKKPFDFKIKTNIYVQTKQVNLLQYIVNDITSYINKIYRGVKNTES